MFTLEIRVSPSSLDIIKRHLCRKLPAVKSSHRCEAIARGLGFTTYASARATSDNSLASANGAAFAGYLASHGFAALPSALYRAVAEAALHKIADAHPILTVWGMGAGQPRRTSDGRWETAEEKNQRFRESRADLTRDGTIEAFLTSIAFLQNVPKTKTIRQGTGSYFVKHTAENYPCTFPEGEQLGPQYVPNGALIAAAIQSGFRYKLHDDELGYYSVNVTFNMSKACLDDLDCMYRPNGARAHKRKSAQERQVLVWPRPRRRAGTTSVRA
jgi:hypothetical protein